MLNFFLDAVRNVERCRPAKIRKGLCSLSQKVSKEYE